MIAKLGDFIACKVSLPYVRELMIKLTTPEACAEGNELLLNENSGWYLVPSENTNKGEIQ